jgi:hypothetical protein
MVERLPDKKTQVSRQAVLEALWKAWMVYFNAVPKKESIWVLMSQWALETGWGRSMHCFNMGNAKSRKGDGYNYTYFKCNEIFRTKSAERYQARDPEHAKITSYRDDGTAIIWFYPDHPACRFRAFRTIHEGAYDYLSMLVKRFHMAWPAVVEGSPAKFAHLLKVQGYYTADEREYTDTLTKVYHMIAEDSRLRYGSLPFMTEDEKRQLQNLFIIDFS